MLSALEEAFNNKEPIMITAWSPHFMFAKWDLKYLKVSLERSNMLQQL
ncbi:hypothetical protein CFK40_10235 [Virgibacillus necropolis]|uniref:ABC-type glycine betaine transport system substrate-binding domain-containing protein n=1 Tax=Virgibacillus necropolis TaxID=163877 RepID=A0A221MCJ1_9BACI|nr:hypothetical protein CFK40_10235 [Virgibacillus necropolis]